MKEFPPQSFFLIYSYSTGTSGTVISVPFARIFPKAKCSTCQTTNGLNSIYQAQPLTKWHAYNLRVFERNGNVFSPSKAWITDTLRAITDGQSSTSIQHLSERVSGNWEVQWSSFLLVHLCVGCILYRGSICRLKSFTFLDESESHFRMK